MQRVVRLSFVGLLAIAGASFATACGDKVTVPPAQAQDSVVHSVTVSPPSASLNIGDKFQFGASVDAGPGVTDRTVTWSSSNSAVASVDQTGLVTAVAAGNASIVATSKANTQVSGAASVTVAAVVHASVTIGQINQTTCVVGGGCASVPAQLGNVANQLDVTLNVDPGTEKVSEVDLLMNCGGADTLVGKQTFASADVAPVVDDASSPVTISFNTAAFSPTTGAVAFKNGVCTLKAKAITTTGTQSAVSSTQLTLNNANVVVATLTTVPGTNQVASATDASGLTWRAGAVTATVIPVVYTANVTIASAAVNLVNGGNDGALGKNGTAVASGGNVATLSGLTPASGVVTASFPLSTTATGGVGGAVVDTLTVSVNTVDSNGNPGPTLAASTGNFIRLDNRAPNIGTATPPTYVAGTQNTANGWVGANFVFSTSAGSLTADSASKDNLAELIAINGNGQLSAGGVDKVTIKTQWAPQGTSASSSAWATFTSVADLAETSAATGSVAYDLRLQICDALGNCATTPTLTTFGVDKTPPTASTTAGPADKEIDGIGMAISSATVSVGASDPQGTAGVTGSGFGANPVLVTETRLAPVTVPGTDQATTCVIGLPLSPNTGCKSGSLMSLTFPVVTTDPGQYALSYVVVDQAGNQSAPAALSYYLDGPTLGAPAAPSMSGGIGIPASITNGSQFTASGTDNMDFASANAVLVYPVAAIDIPATSSAAGVAFDNTLTRASNVTVTLSNFMRSLGAISAGVITSAQAKPTTIGIRGVDAANNLSPQDQATFPATNIATGTTLAVGTDLADFSITSDQATLANGTSTTGARSATLTATVKAVDANHGTPFSQVCFYIQNPSGAEGGQAAPVTGGAAGEFALLGCTSTTTTTLSGTDKLISSTMSFDPAAAYGTSGSLNIVAIGITANGDALMTGTPVAIGLTN